MTITKKNDFLIKIAMIAVAVFAVVALLIMRIKISELSSELTNLENEVSSYKEQIDELTGTSDAGIEFEKGN